MALELFHPAEPGVVRRTSIAVCICTCERNGPLVRLLEALENVSADVAPRADVGVVIVDDDPAGGAQQVLERFADRFPLGLVYRQSGLRNISVARNAVLAAGAAIADWLAMIDDDCLPIDRWLSALLDIQTRTGADAVTGACTELAPPHAPAWVTSQPFLVETISDTPDGEEPQYGATKNTMIRSAWLNQHPEIRFERSLGRLGGEDMVFFYRARSAGLVHRYSAEAMVTEVAPEDRTRYRYLLWRRFWFGNTQYVTNVIAGRATRMRMAARGGRALVRAVVRPFSRLARREPPQWRWASAEIACATGMLVGTIGVRVNHH
jgi:succinoglycan biosynthesis protein ExoM